MEEGDLCEQNSSGVGVLVHTLYFFYETAAWNHLILYMHISLGGLFKKLGQRDLNKKIDRKICKKCILNF